MRLDKRIIGVALAATMALSSASAFATTLPTAKDNAQKFQYVERFYDDGLYYEAREILNQVVDNETTYDQVKAAAWEAKVNSAIQELEFNEAVEGILGAYKAGNLAAANSGYATLAAMDLDYDQSAARDCVRALLLAPVTNASYAELLVTNTYGELDAPDLYYSTVKVPGGYDVYVKSTWMNGNVAAYHVSTSGAVTVDNVDWPGMAFAD